MDPSSHAKLAKIKELLAAKKQQEAKKVASKPSLQKYVRTHSRVSKKSAAKRGVASKHAGHSNPVPPVTPSVPTKPKKHTKKVQISGGAYAAIKALLKK